jgi:hypothetical protein
MSQVQQEQRRSTVQQLAELFEATGLPEREALEIAQQIARDANDVTPGAIFGGTHADLLPALWGRARGSGATSLTVRLEVDDDGYHTRITILERGEGPSAERDP